MLTELASILTNIILARNLSLSLSNIGVIIRHGPHHSAPKSTTSCAEVPSVRKHFKLYARASVARGIQFTPLFRVLEQVHVDDPTPVSSRPRRRPS